MDWRKSPARMESCRKRLGFLRRASRGKMIAGWSGNRCQGLCRHRKTGMLASRQRPIVAPGTSQASPGCQPRSQLEMDQVFGADPTYRRCMRGLQHGAVCICPHHILTLPALRHAPVEANWRSHSQTACPDGDDTSTVCKYRQTNAHQLERGHDCPIIIVPVHPPIGISKSTSHSAFVIRVESHAPIAVSRPNVDRRFGSVILSQDWKDGLWDKFVMEAPRSSHVTPLMEWMAPAPGIALCHSEVS